MDFIIYNGVSNTFFSLKKMSILTDLIGDKKGLKHLSGGITIIYRFSMSSIHWLEPIIRIGSSNVQIAE